MHLCQQSLLSYPFIATWSNTSLAVATTRICHSLSKSLQTLHFRSFKNTNSWQTSISFTSSGQVRINYSYSLFHSNLLPVLHPSMHTRWFAKTAVLHPMTTPEEIKKQELEMVEKAEALLMHIAKTYLEKATPSLTMLAPSTNTNAASELMPVKSSSFMDDACNVKVVYWKQHQHHWSYSQIKSCVIQSSKVERAICRNHWLGGK